MVGTPIDGYSCHAGSLYSGYHVSAVLWRFPISTGGDSLFRGFCFILLAGVLVMDMLQSMGYV